MKCTSCRSGVLNPSYLEGLFPCHTCNNCEGTLVMLADYLRWQGENENSKFVAQVADTIEAEETTRALICPKTGGLMTKYRISKETDHRLDLSPTINAVWMDKGEWQLLKDNGLAGSLSTIFTDHWQTEIRSQESADIMLAFYERIFGENYEQIKAFREMLNETDIKSEAIAYLIADDPYKA